MKRIKKILSLIMLLLLSNVVFAKPFESEIQERRMNIKRVINENGIYFNGGIVADFEEADIFLEFISESNKNYPNFELILIFPTTDKLEEYLPIISKKISKVKVFLFNEKENGFNLQNRSIEELKKKNYDNLVKLENVKIVGVDLSEYDKKDLYIESFLSTNTVNRKYMKFAPEYVK